MGCVIERDSTYGGAVDEVGADADLAADVLDRRPNGSEAGKAVEFSPERRCRQERPCAVRFRQGVPLLLKRCRTR